MNQPSCPASVRLLLIAVLGISFVAGGQDTTLFRGDTLRIAGVYSRTGNINVYGGVFIARNARLNLAGNLVAALGGTITIDSSVVVVGNRQGHESVWGAYDSSFFSATSCSTSFTHMFAICSGPSAVMIWGRVNHAGHISGTAMNGGTVRINNVNLVFEWVIRDSSVIEVRACDSAVIEPMFTAGMTAGISLDTGRVDHYVLDRNTANTSGINFHLALDSIGSVQWAPYSYPGSSLTISGSYMRGILVVLPPPDPVSFDSVFSHTAYADYSFPVQGRTLRFVNTFVESYNIYPGGFYGDNLSGSMDLRMDYCLTGDFLTFGGSRVAVRQLNVDGYGGAAIWMNRSVVACTLSVINTSLTVTDTATGHLVDSYHTRGALTVTGNACLYCCGTFLHAEASLYEASRMWNASMTISDTLPADTQISIVGTAWIDCGPEANVNLASRGVFLRSVAGGPWQALSADQTNEVRGGRLAEWTPAIGGFWELGLRLKGNNGDSLWYVRKVFVAGGAAIRAPGISGDGNPVIANGADKIMIRSLYPLARMPELFDVKGRYLGPAIRDPRTESPLYYFPACQSCGPYILRINATSGAAADYRVLPVISGYR